MVQKKRWTRLVDSAQRRIVVDAPRTLSGIAPDQVRFEIQGLRVHQGQRKEMVPYYEMHERGLALDLCKRLSVWDRIRRYPAAVGSQRIADEVGVISLWTEKPFLQLAFQMDSDEEAVLFQECRYMVLSAGFYLLKVE